MAKHETVTNADVDAKILTHKDDASAHHVKTDFFDRFREFIPWISLEGFTTGGDAGAGCVANGSMLEIWPKNLTDNDSWIKTTYPWRSILDIGKQFTFEFPIFRLSSITNQNIWLHMSNNPQDPPSETSNHFGWKIIGGDLYASNADGTTQKITDTGVDLGTGYQRTRLKVVLKRGTDCKFYVNDVLKVTHTENLPNTNFLYLHFHIRTLEDDYKYINIGRVLLEQEN